MSRPLEGSEPKRSPLNMRTSSTLRARIEQAAKDSGISLSQEVERRLERSFRDDDVVAAVTARMAACVPAYSLNEVLEALSAARGFK